MCDRGRNFLPFLNYFPTILQVIDNEDLEYNIGGDEHGILRPSGKLKVSKLH